MFRGPFPPGTPLLLIHRHPGLAVVEKDREFHPRRQASYRTDCPAGSIANKSKPPFQNPLVGKTFEQRLGLFKTRPAVAQAALEGCPQGSGFAIDPASGMGDFVHWAGNPSRQFLDAGAAGIWP